MKIEIMAWKEGIEIKVQAKKFERLIAVDNLAEKLAQDSNIDHVVKIGTDRVRAVASLSQAQKKIDSVIEEESMKKSQFVIKTTKIRV